MLYVYIINILIYSGTCQFTVRFGYFRYRNIGAVRIFKGLGPVPISDISIRFQFSSSVPGFLPRPQVVLGLKQAIKVGCFYNSFCFSSRGISLLSHICYYYSYLFLLTRYSYKYFFSLKVKILLPLLYRYINSYLNK